jgi:hypothetical protein
MTLESVFWVSAVIGSILFVGRFAMMLMGADHGGGDVAGHGDGGFGNSDLGYSDLAFEFFSLNTIMAFFMMFGWAGLACYKQYSMGAAISVFVALAAGLVSMVIVVYVFRMVRKLSCAGCEFNIEDTVGEKASVYQLIPETGKGRIQVSVKNGVTREIDAVSADRKEIKSFETVEVVGVVDKNTVSVRKA